MVKLEFKVKVNIDVNIWVIVKEKDRMIKINVIVRMKV